MDRLKPFLQLTALAGLFVGLGALLGGVWLLACALLGLALCVVAYFWSDRLVLCLQGARSLGHGEAPGLEADVAELAARAGIPVPRIVIIPDDALNAFAIGRNPNHGKVAFTEGLLHCLPRRELRGVIAHVVALIQHRDTAARTMASGVLGALSLLANPRQPSTPNGQDADEKRPTAAATLGLGWVTPFMEGPVDLAIFRSREFLADEKAAHLTGDPEGLVLALHRFEGSREFLKAGSTAHPATACLMISAPFSREGWASSFSTHRPMVARVALLRSMAPCRWKIAS